MSKCGSALTAIRNSDDTKFDILTLQDDVAAGVLQCDSVNTGEVLLSQEASRRVNHTLIYFFLDSQYGGAPNAFFMKSMNSRTLAGRNLRSGYTA